MNVRFLAYHQIADNGKGHPYTIHPDVFRQQMRRIADRGGKGLSIHEAMQGCGENDVALSFDDGTLDFTETVLPILKEFGFTATVFVITGLVGQYATWPEMAGVVMMTWDDIQAAEAAGMEIGSHTDTHKALTAISMGRVINEIADAQYKIERELGHKACGFAYPFGLSDGAIIEQVMKFHEYAVGADNGTNPEPYNRYNLRRTVMRAHAYELAHR